jgi:hypothetical protein
MSERVLPDLSIFKLPPPISPLKESPKKPTAEELQRKRTRNQKARDRKRRRDKEFLELYEWTPFAPGFDERKDKIDRERAKDLERIAKNRGQEAFNPFIKPNRETIDKFLKAADTAFFAKPAADRDRTTLFKFHRQLHCNVDLNKK